MEIKRTGFTRPEFTEVTSVNEANKSKGRFGRQQNAPLPNMTSASIDVLPGVRAVYQRKDLQIAAKRDSAVQQALGELIQKEFPAAGALPPVQRAYLVDWMAKDPLIQSRMVSYLQRTLE
jgi:hypothetical protein